MASAILLLILQIGCSKREGREELEAETATQVSVQPGWAFETALQELSIPQDLSGLIIESMKDIFDFRRCMPGDRAVLVTAADSQFKRFEYHRSPTRYYLVTTSDTGMVASEVTLNTQRKIYFVEGSIKSSLYKSILDSGEGPELAYLLSDIFAWDIDFNVETRVNDRFSVLVVKEYLDSDFIGYGPILYATYAGNAGAYEATRFEDTKGRADYYDKKGKSLRKLFLRSPLQYRRITSYFSKRRFHPILKIYCPHHGVDYAAPVGTPISAIGDGVVTFAGWKGGYGRLIYLKHSNGYQSGYGHLSGFARGIKKGKRVHQGQLIGYVGNTGRSTGPHLHFEMKRNGRFINPLQIKVPAAAPITRERMALFQKQRTNMAALANAYALMSATRELAGLASSATPVADSALHSE